MAKKGFFRRVADRVADALLGRKEQPKKAAPAPQAPVVAPPRPTAPPKPRRPAPSPLSVEERVRLYKAKAPLARREQRPQDEDSRFWALYDGRDDV